MSNYFAIATVTATLSDLILETINIFPGVEVKTERPDSIKGDISFKGVNIYMYHVSSNVSLRNQDLPIRNFEGSLVQRPQVALNLHYLLTFYGEEKHLETQLMMARVMSELNAKPYLLRQKIKQVVQSKGTYSFLEESDLYNQPDQLRVVPHYLDLEELSKIWNVFRQETHRLSMAYSVSVVMLESAPEYFKLASHNLENLRKIGLPASQIKQLKPLKNELFKSKEEFVKALNENIPNLGVDALETILVYALYPGKPLMPKQTKRSFFSRLKPR